MSRTTKRAAPGDGGSVERRLARLLDAPFLARVVPHLPPETLRQLVRHRGLEACGELLTSATPAQLTSLLDLDLWRHAQPGRGEQLDADRFGDWLEVLADTGHAARTVSVLDTDLVVAGLSRYVRVFDPGIFEPTAQSDDEAVDRHDAMREGDSVDVSEPGGAASTGGDRAPTRDPDGASLECEVGGYVVRARRADAWDAVVTLLAALEAEHADCFHAVMQGCRRLSNSRPELDGLDDLLPAPEQQLHDVAVARERRRSQQGYATPGDARAFLQMARRPTRAGSGASATTSIEVNPIVTAYFRAADEDPEPSEQSPAIPPPVLRPSGSGPPARASRPASDAAADATDVPESIGAIIELLNEAGMMPERPRALLEGGDADPQEAGLARLRQLARYVRDVDETAHFTRSRELAFLANALLAGCSVSSRPFTPPEASEAAASICNLGLEYWPARWPGATARDGRHAFPPDSFLIDHDLVTAFEVGWSVLHQEVSSFVARELVSTLDEVHSVDRDVQRELLGLRRALVDQLRAGTPWLARPAASVLATLDVATWVSVLGLLDECPILPAALTAILEGRTTGVSPTAFVFISTAAQIADVRTFMRKLPSLLSP
jgi:hypothetical protein